MPLAVRGPPASLDSGAMSMNEFGQRSFAWVEGVDHEVATMLYNGLALDGLDEHDARAVVAGLCVDLVAEDPGGAMRERARATPEDSGDLHEPDAVSGDYLVSASILKL